MEGKLHVYHPKRKLILFEYTTRPQQAETLSGPTSTVETSTSSSTANVLLWIGGLFDNFRLTGYVDDLAAIFRFSSNTPNSDQTSSPSAYHSNTPNIQPRWALMQIQLSSAMKGWGTSDLNRDADEIGVAVDYIRHEIYGVSRNESQTPQTKGVTKVNIILMGHSTGCQDVVHYLYTSPDPSSSSSASNITSPKPRPKVQGAILQAAISDRDMLQHIIKTSSHHFDLYSKCMAIISQTPENQHKTTILPTHYTTPLWEAVIPISISRFLSMFSPDSPDNPKDDDLFSLELGETRIKNTIGKAGRSSALEPSITTTTTTPSRGRGILIIFSAQDQFVIDAKTVLPKQLVRWNEICGQDVIHRFSCTLQNSNHDLSDDPSLSATNNNHERNDNDDGEKSDDNDDDDVEKGQGKNRSSEYDRLVNMRNVVLDYLDDILHPFSSSDNNQQFESDIRHIKHVISTDEKRLLDSTRQQKPKRELKEDSSLGVKHLKL